MWQTGECFSCYMLKLSLIFFFLLGLLFTVLMAVLVLFLLITCQHQCVLLVQSSLQILWRPQNSWIKAPKPNTLLSEQWSLWIQASCGPAVWELWWPITPMSLRVAAHVGSLMADKRWAHTLVLLLWGASDWDLSPFLMWEAGTQGVWVLSPAVRLGGGLVARQVYELCREGIAKIDEHMCTHGVIWWPFKLSPGKPSTPHSLLSLQGRCSSRCGWHRWFHSRVVIWSHLKMSEGLGLGLRFGLIRLHSLSFFQPEPFSFLLCCTNPSCRNRDGMRGCKYFVFTLAAPGLNAHWATGTDTRRTQLFFLKKINLKLLLKKKWWVWYLAEEE